MYIHVLTYIYIYTHIDTSMCVYMTLSLYTFTYIYVYIHERYGAKHCMELIEALGSTSHALPEDFE